MIVGSILLAFTIDAAWDGRQDRSREASYVRMLATDLRATLRNNENFSARAAPIDLATASLARAYYEPELPHVDSIRQWFARVGTGWVVQPRLGTAQSLITTGDLRLIRSDSIRENVTAYLTTMIAFDGFEQWGDEDWEVAREELTHHVDLELAALEMLPAAERDALVSTDPLSVVPAGPLRPAPLVDWEALVRDEEVHRILTRMSRSKAVMAQYRNLMKIRSERFLAQVEAELRNQGGRD